MLGTLAHRFAWMRRSLLTVWICAFVIGLSGWVIAGLLAVVTFNAIGGFCL